MHVIKDFMNDLDITDPNLFKVAYSPLKPSSIMLIGDNPGGDPGLPETIANDKEDYLEGEHDFLDEDYTLAVKTRQLFRNAFGAKGDEILRNIPTTNLSFLRSPSQLPTRERSVNREKCWPYIVRILEFVQPKLILCNGMSVFRFLRSRLASTEDIDQAAPLPATGQRIFYRKAKGTFSALDNRMVELVGFHHLTGYRWSRGNLAELAVRIRSDVFSAE